MADYNYRYPALAGPSDTPGRVMRPLGPPPGENQVVSRPTPALTPFVPPGRVISPGYPPIPEIRRPPGMVQRQFTARLIPAPAADGSSGVELPWRVPGFPYQGFRGFDGLGAWDPAPDLSSVTAGRSILARGQKGPAVASLQNALTASGIATDADGMFGPITESAVKLAQSRHGLPVTGTVDSATWAALAAQPSASISKGKVALASAAALWALWLLA